MPKRRYINFSVSEEVPGYSSLSAEPRARESCAVQCARCVRFAGFCLLCSWATLQAVGPWVLSVIEVGTLLLVYLVAQPLPPAGARWDLSTSLLDLLLASAVRAALISAAYAYGTWRYYLRPYLYTAYTLGVAGCLLAGAQAALYAYPPRWYPAAGLLAAFSAFSVLHILTARRVVLLARRRLLLGLSPPPAVPWAVSEQAWLLAAAPAGHRPWPLTAPGSTGATAAGSPVSLRAPLLQPPTGVVPGTPTTTAAAAAAAAADEEAPAVEANPWEVEAAVAALADEDSQWVHLLGVTLHYKEAWPCERHFQEHSFSLGSPSSADATAAAGLTPRGSPIAGSPHLHRRDSDSSFRSAASGAESGTSSMVSARSSPTAAYYSSSSRGPSISASPAASRHLLTAQAVASCTSLAERGDSAHCSAASLVQLDAAGSPPPPPPHSPPTHPPAAGTAPFTSGRSAEWSAGEPAWPPSPPPVTSPSPSPSPYPSAAAGGGGRGAPAAADVGIVLVHGFGGGVFSWRHVMQPLADATGCRVVALDRPGFGLSSRPHPITPEASQHGGPTTTATAAAAPASGPNQQQPAAVSSSPYSIPFQAQLVLGLARHLQLSRVLLVGHADGCLVAVAAATAAVAAAGGAASGSGSSSGGAWGRAPGVQQMTGRNGGSAGAGGGGARGVAAGPDLAALDLTWMASLSQANSASTIAAALSPLLHHAPSGSSSGTDWPAVPPGGGMPNPPAAASGVVDSRSVAMPVSAPGAGQDVRGGPGNSSAGVSPRALTPPNTPAMPAPVSSYQPTSQQAATAASAAGAGLSQAGEGGSSWQGQSSRSPGGLQGTRGSSSGGGGGAGRVLSPSRLSQAGYPGTSAAAAAAGGSSSGDGAAASVAEGAAALNGDNPPSASGGSMQLPQAPAGAWYPDLRQQTAAPQQQHQQQQQVAVVALALLHPALSGHLVPSYTRLLARSPVGRGMLRRLLAAEVGEVAVRRGWYNKAALTEDVLELYKRPLQVPGWDAAVLACSAAAAELTPPAVLGSYLAVQHLPLLLLTGDHDTVASPAKLLGLASAMSSRGVSVAVLEQCGHMAQEEAPASLLHQLALFVQQVQSFGGA